MVSNLKCRCHGVFTGDRHRVLLTVGLRDFFGRARDRLDLVRGRRVVTFCDTSCDAWSLSLLD